MQMFVILPSHFSQSHDPTSLIFWSRVSSKIFFPQSKCPTFVRHADGKRKNRNHFEHRFESCLLYHDWYTQVFSTPRFSLSSFSFAVVNCTRTFLSRFWNDAPVIWNSTAKPEVVTTRFLPNHDATDGPFRASHISLAIVYWRLDPNINTALPTESPSEFAFEQ